MNTIPKSFREWVGNNPLVASFRGLPSLSEVPPMPVKPEPFPVMLDLETLGNRPGSVIVAIGAVKFRGGVIYERFYRRVTAESCERVGLTIDASTVMWWMRQSEEARREICMPGHRLEAVLDEFADWMEPGAKLWGNGANFDNVLLGGAYDAAGIARPWKHWQDRCYRTAKNFRPEIPMRREGVHHNALADAESQARHLMEICEAMERGAL